MLLRQRLMEQMESRMQVEDEELRDLIDMAILEAAEGAYLPLKERLCLRKELFDSFRRLDILQELVDDPTITEIMVNGTEHIFVERQGRVEELEKHFDSVGQLEDLIQQIVSRVNRTVNLASPIADARLEDGSRVHVVLAPVALNGPILTIRKFPEPITMERLIELKSISREAAAFLQKAVERGLNIFISGGTGSGKTTILKILNEVIRPDVGSFTLGSRVQIGYYDQEHQVLHMEKTIFQEISDAYPYLTNTEIRNVLAAFLFTNDDGFQPIHTLSGGERGRISLAKLMLSNANFLILDEPTNHLDIVSKEILENALKDYTGTVLYVSHDRYFINQTATRILELTGQTLVNYIGNYDYYLEKKEELTRIYAPAADAAAPEEAAAPSEASSTKLDWKAQKEEQARLRKKENELKKTEKRIEELETRDSEIDEEMSKPEVATNVAECVKLSKEKAEIAAELEELYEKWEELAE